MKIVASLSVFAGLLATSLSAQLANSGFETGDLFGWNVSGNVLASTDRSLTGDWSAKLGLTEESLLFQTFATSPGEVWSFSGSAYLDVPLFDSLGLVKLVWRDAGGADLPPADILAGFEDNPAFPGIRSVIIDASFPLQTWTELEVSGVAPTGATEAAFYALAIPLSPFAGNLSIYFDDFSVTRSAIPEPSLAGIGGLGLIGLLLLGRRRRR